MAGIRNPNLMHCIWVPVATNAANTVYEGSIVTMGTDGVLTLGAASGAWNTTHKTTYPGLGIPLGIVLGTSRRYELFDSTQNQQKIISLITSNANFYPAGPEMAGIGGVWGMDSQAYVYVHLLFPDTIVTCPIYFSSLGTAPTVATVASGASATGMGYTTGASIGFTPIASLSTSFCRSGLNRGFYRVMNGTDPEIEVVTSPFPRAIAVGDTFVHVNLKSFGTSRAQLDATASFVDGAAAVSNDYYGIDVVALDLNKPGGEFVDFRFNPYNFLPALT